jgi:hypothetical protein
MSEDLISDNFVENIDRAIIKRNILLSKTALILGSLYTLINILSWYSELLKLHTLPKGRLLFFFYTIAPVVEVILFSISIYGYLVILKANKLIEASIEKTEADLFNYGYKYFCRASILSITIIIVSISMVFIRFVLQTLG